MAFGREFLYIYAVSLKYIDMIYINVGEMCFDSDDRTHELFNFVRQLMWQHLSPVVSTFFTSIKLVLSSFFILKQGILPPSFSLFLSR